MDGSDTYLYIFDGRRAGELLRQLGRQAADPDLSFTWHMAGEVARRVEDLTDGINGSASEGDRDDLR